MGLHSEGWNEDWTGDGQDRSGPLPSVRPARSPGQPRHCDFGINRAGTMSVEKRPGSHGATPINQQLIQSCEMPRLIKLCQHFLCCQAQSPSLPLPWRREGPLPTTREGRRKWGTREDSRRTHRTRSISPQRSEEGTRTGSHGEARFQVG